MRVYVCVRCVYVCVCVRVRLHVCMCERMYDADNSKSCASNDKKAPANTLPHTYTSIYVSTAS